MDLARAKNSESLKLFENTIFFACRLETYPNLSTYKTADHPPKQWFWEEVYMSLISFNFVPFHTFQKNKAF